AGTAGYGDGGGGTDGCSPAQLIIAVAQVNDGCARGYAFNPDGVIPRTRADVQYAGVKNSVVAVAGNNGVIAGIATNFVVAFACINPIIAEATDNGVGDAASDNRVVAT